MKIDVTTLMNKRASSQSFEYELDAPKVDCGIILPEEFILSPCTVRGVIKDQNNCMSLSCEVICPYTTLCDRCLDTVEGTLTFEIEKTVSTAAAPEGFEDDPLYDDVVFVSESALDIDSAVVEEIALRLPPYHLCREDCPGLCPKCGKRLADGPCGCEKIKEIDPRLKKLQKLLDNFD